MWSLLRWTQIQYLLDLFGFDSWMCVCMQAFKCNNGRYMARSCFLSLWLLSEENLQKVLKIILDPRTQISDTVSIYAVNSTNGSWASAEEQSLWLQADTISLTHCLGMFKKKKKGKYTLKSLLSSATKPERMWWSYWAYWTLPVSFQVEFWTLD